MDQIYSLKKQKQVSQNSSMVDENIEQVNTGLVEELKIKLKLRDNENKFLREERDNNKNLLDTNLDHNNRLLKYNEYLHQNPYLSKQPSGTADKLLLTFSITSYQPIYLKTFKVKKKARKVTKMLLVLIATKMRIMWFTSRETL